MLLKRRGYKTYQPPSRASTLAQQQQQPSPGNNAFTRFPAAQGLYQPELEKDSCGVGMIVNIKGNPSHDIVKHGREVLVNMTHRGAVGAEENSGDGAGILASIPHKLYARALEVQGVTLPPLGQYATGMVFLSANPDVRQATKRALEERAASSGLAVLAWRDIATDNSSLGSVAKSAEPGISQLFVVPNEAPNIPVAEATLRRRAFRFMREARKGLAASAPLYFCSLNTRTIVYKGQLTPEQLFPYFPEDLSDPLFSSHVVIVHSRFSTNTFPSWERAQPLRYIGHNGEINTLKGNSNWMRAREGVMSSPHFAALDSLYPVIEPNGSDSQALDNSLEFLLNCSDRSLPETMMMLVPEAWENMHSSANGITTSGSTAARRHFYEWASHVSEPWDGPALFTFTDGRFAGATLDRNGLRPSRFLVTKDDLLVMASEIGVVEGIPSNSIIKKGRLEPGRMLLVDTLEGKIVNDHELKEKVATSRPYGKWIKGAVRLLPLVEKAEQLRSQSEHDNFSGAWASLPGSTAFKGETASSSKLVRPSQAVRSILLPLFGYTQETVSMLLAPMGEHGKEALGSMGNDAPLAVLSRFPKLPSEYFKQLFAQVTNPPIDPIREAVVMSLRCAVGPSGNILETSAQQCHRLVLDSPILTDAQLDAIKHVEQLDPSTGFATRVFPLEYALSSSSSSSSAAVEEGYSFIVLSDRGFVAKTEAALSANPASAHSSRFEQAAPISALLAVGAVHQHLLRSRQRLKVALIVETAEAREVHHHCLMVGFGADAVCPYLALDVIRSLSHKHTIRPDVHGRANSTHVSQSDYNYIKSVNAGMLKVMAKMGISTLQSFKGAQIFEAIGLGQSVIDLCFTGTTSAVGGIGFAEIAYDTEERHRLAQVLLQQHREQQSVVQGLPTELPYLSSSLSSHSLQGLSFKAPTTSAAAVRLFSTTAARARANQHHLHLLASTKAAGAATLTQDAPAAADELATSVGQQPLHQTPHSVKDRHPVVPVTAGSLLSASLANRGDYHWRANGEAHINDPESIAFLQDAARRNNTDAFARYTEYANAAVRGCTLRGVIDIVGVDTPASSESSGSAAVPLEEVESAASILTRFCTGAMSYGSISEEAHTTLAIAMNRIGGKSNTGEGGEDRKRYASDPSAAASSASSSTPQADSMRSAIKQIASGRFGVTIDYLYNSDEIQIKMAQGAKPGEGGELPGHKVTGNIAATRHSTPGVGLISPPPHHDIYSIEDLSQLISDMKCANPKARISVKLVSETGVGIVASGVAKGKADHILVSGHDGGTGASTWTGVKSAGLPWELGLAETHQTLVLNGLRGRVVLQTDGQLRTARDVVVAALLGAEEFGFATVPLIALGCTMMRKCHLNTCPVGIATQDPVLRAKFAGKPEHVVNFFFMLAEDIRGIMSKLGVRKFDELVGRSDWLAQRAADPLQPEQFAAKLQSIDLKGLLTPAFTLRPNVPTRFTTPQQHDALEATKLENRLLSENEALKQLLTGPAAPSVGTALTVETTIKNIDRTFGTLLSYHATAKFGAAGLPSNDALVLQLHGSAGQSLAAFLAPGITVKLFGDSNDYVGKGLSGGIVVVRPPLDMPAEFKSDENVIVGNVCLYGATSGRAFFAGVAAERFAVRNSGALAVCEGVGDHGCEYMTGGRVVILGQTGINFAAGMSGGIAYVLDRDNEFSSHRCNREMVLLERVAAGSSDETELLELIREHVTRTDSAVAKAILSDWESIRPKFVKVFPHDYKRVLEQQKQQKQQQQQQQLQQPAASKQAPAFDAAPRRFFSMAAARRSGANSTIKPTSSSFTSAKPLDKLRGFVTVEREEVGYRNEADRVHDWEEVLHPTHVEGKTTASERAQTKAAATPVVVATASSDEHLAKQTSRCMDCGVPFCQSKSHGCPIGNLIPQFNELVFQGNWREAYLQLSTTNNFPEFTGRACPAPCEGACVVGIIDKPVTIKNVENAIIDHAFEQGWVQPIIPMHRTGKRVAVVGSGPAGLAAADQLNRAGHSVTVYERSDRFGGLLMYGIPNMKLDKRAVQRRIELLRASGVVFVPNTAVGTSQAVDDLAKEFDAVLLCTGSTVPRDLPVPGRNGRGVHFAMDYLEPSTRALLGDFESSGHKVPAEYDAHGKNVVVIGGGDTGADCIATAIRQGARSVVQFEINLQPSKDGRAAANPWPQYPKVFKVDYAHGEAAAVFQKDPREYVVLSTAFAVDPSSKRVTGVHTNRLAWDVPAHTHESIAGSEHTFPADLVLLAMGYQGPESEFAVAAGVQLNSRGNFATALPQPGLGIDVSYRTHANKIYAAGDCRRGQSLIVWAINEGRMAAREIDLDLMGRTLLPVTGGVTLASTSQLAPQRIAARG
ncbi:glutamate synthase Glt1 [Capsaspora owczarzaki ATCC 30864]|uniref:glutamate synthase Glt1 n=1 Tax=Capsaspora owczarzaki (strain ATCC 30864) TaxID=595528 RepID=UPI000352177C|nr:glutamate synthase Glt1 [Capsaspora owczarzaki ATCC 30864]|eukprot:XP_004363740.2 glutamate synthase Glt1 [Capsaspora owczarzaki ATCC 30864]